MNMTSTAIIPLGRLTPAEQAHAGAKAANCARLQQAGFPVPDGIVVMAQATAATSPRSPRIRGSTSCPRTHDSRSGPPASAKTARASRSPAFTRPCSTCRESGLAAAIDTCLASSRAPQALEYRRAKGLPTETIEMALLIQRMVDPIAAGVAFTVNPVSGAEHEIVINSSWGLGDALVSGRIEPDEFIINKRDGTLKWSRLGQKGDETGEPIASLSAERLRELSAMLAKIEQHYGSPQDVEWCLDDDGLWIVQSRPVTTRQANTQEIEWTRANFAEVLPDLTSPQALDAFEDLLTRAERLYLGGLMGDEAAFGPMVKIFYGRMHFNLTQLRRICRIGGMAPAEMLRSMGHADTIQPADEVVTRPSLESLKYVPDFARLMWQHLTIARIIRKHEAVAADYMRQLAAIDPRTMPDTELWSGVEHWVVDRAGIHADRAALDQRHRARSTHPQVLRTHRLPVRAAGLPAARDWAAIGERAAGVRPGRTGRDRTTGAERPPSSWLGTMLAPRTCAPRSPVPRLSPRSIGSSSAMDIAGATSPTGRCRATRTIRRRFSRRFAHTSRTQRRPTPQRRSRGKSRPHATRGRRSSSVCRGGSGRRSCRQSNDRSGASSRYYLWREQVRSDLIRLLAVLRPWHLVLADRFAERGWIAKRDDYFLLKLREIGAVIHGEASPNGLRAIAAERAAELERYAAIEMPLLMRPSELASLIRMAGVSGGDDDGALTGQPVSGGCVEGEVVVVRDPGDFARMKRGAILVAPATDPSWTPLFTLASGVIVEVGGVLSHASTIAREYGLPALANVKNATKRLRTGDRVRLDAVNGIVHRLPLPPATLAS